MRLSDDRINAIKLNLKYLQESKTQVKGVLDLDDTVNLIDTIEALEQENEQLKADLRGKDDEINDLKALAEYLIEGFSRISQKI